MAGRRLQGLQLLVLLWACVHPSLADDQDKSAIITASRGPETQVVSNATELGRALQDHFVTNIIIQGRVHLKNENWVAGGTASIMRGRHVLLQSEHTAPASAVLDFGLLTDAIHVSTGAHLEFQRLHVPNSGNRKLKHPSQHTRLHVAGAFALWPSVTLAQGSKMSMHDCVFYYWSDEQWDSCDKFREAATPILNPTGNPNLLDWRASGTQVSIKGVQQTISRLVDIYTKEDVGAVTMTRTNHTLVCVPDIFEEQKGSPLLIGALSVTGSLLVGAVIAWHLGILDFNPSREPRSSRESSGSGGDSNKASNRSTLDSLAELLRQRERATIGGLELGELLGRGSFGRVYKGRWCGGLVAVKIVAHNCALSSLAEVLRESALSTSITHPNVVTTFKVRTVRSREGGYSNPVATWVHGADNDLDSIAGSHQELLNKALSQAKCSGSVGVNGEKRSQSLKPGEKQRSIDLQQPMLKMARSTPPIAPARSLTDLNGAENMSTPDDPDAFSKLLKRLKESQDVHAASANSAKQAESLVDAKRRHLSEGLHPLESVDSAKPLFGVDDASSSSEASGGGDDSRNEPEPLSMALKSGFRRWPPYQASAAKGAGGGGGPDEEPQPLTREFKGGALSPPSAARSNSDDSTSMALRPPISAFWGKAAVREEDDSSRFSHMPGAATAAATATAQTGALAMDNAKSIGEISLAHHLAAAPTPAEDGALENAFYSAEEQPRPSPPAAGGSWNGRSQLSYSPGANEQHKGELTKARQHGIELLETWLILEYCDCGSLEEAMLEGKYSNDLKSGLLCLMDVAAGMEHLHSMGVLHGDLKGANVLLKSAMASNYDPRGYVCKLADFGLSRVMEHNCTHVSTATFGTAAYMPAELLLEGKMTKAADVYGFAMMAWELFAGEQLFKGLRQSQVICKVMTGWRPLVPEHLPQACADLLVSCWSADVADRPTFAEVLRALHQLVQDM